MKKFVSMFLIAVIALTMSAIVVGPAFAQGTEPPAASVPASVGLLDIAFFVATVAFFKARFKLADNDAFFAAVGVGALFALAPQLMLLLPEASPWVNLALNFAKFVVIGTGSYNFFTDMAPKFAAKLPMPMNAKGPQPK